MTMNQLDVIIERELLCNLSNAIESGKRNELENAREALRKFYDKVMGEPK